MAKVGDRVQVTINGGAAGQRLAGGQTAIGIGPGAAMTVPGRIVADGRTYWVVELSMSLGGANRINVPKT